jgi:hypothetical protein
MVQLSHSKLQGGHGLQIHATFQRRLASLDDDAHEQKCCFDSCITYFRAPDKATLCNETSH